MILAPSDLHDMLNDDTFTIIEAGNNTVNEYIKEHLANAIYLDLNKHLSAPAANPARGGRHPLPSPKDFSGIISASGISASDTVIIYDRNCGANAAARLWWMLRSAGVKNVSVLSGGFEAAKKAGVPVNAEQVITKLPSGFQFNNWVWPVARIEDVEKASQNDILVIDVRDGVRYNGISEPLDPVAGHIPGAINIPFRLNLTEDGLFRSPEALKQFYSDAAKYEQVIVHCGSGVTACHTILAMVHAGLPLPSLYVGSWSEWCRSNNDIITKLPG